MGEKSDELYSFLIFFGWIFISPLVSRAEPTECIQQTLRFKITKTLPRTVLGLTEGLVFEEGKLFESTGSITGHGPSVLNSIDRDSWPKFW